MKDVSMLFHSMFCLPYCTLDVCFSLLFCVLFFWYADTVSQRIGRYAVWNSYHCSIFGNLNKFINRFTECVKEKMKNVLLNFRINEERILTNIRTFGLKILEFTSQTNSEPFNYYCFFFRIEITVFLHMSIGNTLQWRLTICLAGTMHVSKNWLKWNFFSFFVFHNAFSFPFERKKKHFFLWQNIALLTKW